MSTSTTHFDPDLSIALPITDAERAIATEFARQQSTSEKARQVYFNTLAVLVVHDYLQLLDIPTDLEASDSWNPVIRWHCDTADLIIPNIGTLECRSIQAAHVTCAVPPEVWSARLAYVLVQVQLDAKAGKILGFCPSVEGGKMAVHQLQPINRIIPLLHPYQPFVSLHHWFEQTFDSTWQHLEALFQDDVGLVVAYRGNSMPDPTMSVAPNLEVLVQQAWASQQEADRKRIAQQFRAELPHTAIRHLRMQNRKISGALQHLLQVTQEEEIRWSIAESLWIVDPEHPSGGVQRAVEIGQQFFGERLALMIALLPKPNQELAILLRVYPLEYSELPPGLQLTVLDEADQVFLQATSRGLEEPIPDNFVQLILSGHLGERFRVRLQQHQMAWIRDFMI